MSVEEDLKELIEAIKELISMKYDIMEKKIDMYNENSLTSTSNIIKLIILIMLVLIMISNIFLYSSVLQVDEKVTAHLNEVKKDKILTK